MRYFQETKDYMLTYKMTDQLKVIGYSDADYAGCLDSRKSTSGSIFLLAGRAISCRSKKQLIIAYYTIEAEYISCYEASSHAL